MGDKTFVKNAVTKAYKEIKPDLDIKLILNILEIQEAAQFDDDRSKMAGKIEKIVNAHLDTLEAGK